MPYEISLQATALRIGEQRVLSIQNQAQTAAEETRILQTAREGLLVHERLQKCGGRLDTNNRIYFTSAALNDDGDFRHFLVYRSVSRTNTYYFGFEDLYRGGDNDFEDMLVRGTGLVPDCDPRAEACDNIDNDCDMLVDEGVTTACSTACGNGTRTCTAGSFGMCNARVPSAETCNDVDDNCNGSTDEGLSRSCSSICGTGTEICIAGTFAGCTARTPGIESCNNVDDDCDSRTDESLTRACASTCGSGIETCVAGVFGGCTAPLPSVELCNALDDNCNGQVDEGLTRACASACGTGTEVCQAGMYVGCTAPAPRIEACNDLDDDCDSMIDEGLTRACSSACGTGTEMCVAGAYVGCDAPTPSTEICNNLDDDCDGVVDDGNPGGGASCSPLPDGGTGTSDAGTGGTDGGIVCSNGVVRCVDGALVCQGTTTGSREVCNCADDDCDGQIDEEATGALCPGGLCLAAECQCVDPCGMTEFSSCPPGQICDESLGDPPHGIRGYCVLGMCAGVDCMGMEVCNPLTGACEDPCSGVTCATGLVCLGGACVSDDCYGRGCPHGQLCRTPVSGTPTCVDDSVRERDVRWRHVLRRRLVRRRMRQRLSDHAGLHGRHLRRRTVRGALQCRRELHRRHVHDEPLRDAVWPRPHLSGHDVHRRSVRERALPERPHVSRRRLLGHWRGRPAGARSGDGRSDLLGLARQRRRHEHGARRDPARPARDRGATFAEGADDRDGGHRRLISRGRRLLGRAVLLHGLRRRSHARGRR